MQKDIKTVAGCFTIVTCNVTAADGREVQLAAYIAIGQERRPVPKRGKNIFVFPAVEYGQHLYEIRADGKPLIFGFLLVRPSAFPVAEGTVDYTLNATLSSVDALHVDIELTPGPRGYSAYDIAVMEGFEGSEAEWLEHMRQQTATLAVEQVTPLMERAEAAAGEAERESAAAKTSQENAAAHAATARESKLAAAAHKAAAGDEVTKAAAEVTKAAAEVEKARQERETAATHAAAAAKTAQKALANQQGAEQAARDAAQARVEAEQAKADADAASQTATQKATEAAESAAAVAADKTAAEKAKQDALAAQGKAEEEAVKAEQNAALLGDAALQGRNNTFEAGTTQTVNGIGVFNGEVVLNGDISGTGVEYLRAMEALRELQDYTKGVKYSTSEYHTERMEEVFTSPEITDGASIGVYYIDKAGIVTGDVNTIDGCLLLRYDRKAPVEIGTGLSKRCKGYPSKENGLFAPLWGASGNTAGCFSSVFIQDSHLYVKQSHTWRYDEKQRFGHCSFSVYDLGENDVLKETNKLLWYIGFSRSDTIKLVIWGLVGDELKPVVAFRTGVRYWGTTESQFALPAGSATVFAQQCYEPNLKKLLIEKDATVSQKKYETVNNDMLTCSITTFAAEGGELVVNFSPDAGCNWTIEHLPEWLSANVNEIENGGQLVLTAQANEGAERTDYLRFKSVGNHALAEAPCTIHNDVKQDGV